MENNYATVETSGDATVEVSYDDHGHVRPMRDTIDIDVPDGALAIDQTITLTLGERSERTTGHRVQSFPERGFESIALIDAFETSEYVRVLGDLAFDTKPGMAESLRAVVPSEIATGKSFGVSVRGMDYWGNVAISYRGTLKVKSGDGAVLRKLGHEAVKPALDAAL